jgi:hypothetical protein
MNLGKTLFAQLMAFLPWTGFARIVAHYSGDATVSATPSTEYFRIMGLRQAVHRSTLADANERRGNTTLPTPVIAQLYKNRWQVEPFFKWIKQHLRMKRYLGNNENALKTQVWCAIGTYLLIVIFNKELQLKSSPYTCLQILSVSVFEKTLISFALQKDDYKTERAPNTIDSAP